MRSVASSVRSWQKSLGCALVLLGLCCAAHAQSIDNKLGVDPAVDYAALTRLGPWDDRNYKLTKEDLALLAPNEAELLEPVPVFFRVALRKARPELPRSGPAQYPLSALQIFLQTHGGYLVDGKLSTRVQYREGRFVVLEAQEPSAEPAPEAALSGQVRITAGAESAVKISPTDANRAIAGTNGGAMFRSTDGGASWAPAAPLPLGGACCDPTVDWSADGVHAYTATLGCNQFFSCGVWVYRSADGGTTWTDFQNQTPGDPRREVTTASSDKEYLHVDKHGTSPFRDHLYMTWHEGFVMKFSRSTDRGNTWSSPLALSAGDAELGIGSDITTDKNGNVYYFWPAFNSRRILVRKSTNGGASFGPSVQVGSTHGAYYFPIPADQTAFIFVAADTDLSNGPFANRIYVAWADATAASSNTATSNHARVQVAFSGDGGATWSVRTPHETADAGDVDRFQPWLAVGQDGVVYLTFYDTRLAKGRTGVDLFSSRSTDGGNTWSAPVRLTTATSPHIEDAFEWGDYNGLDALSQQLLGVFTDNRNESGGTADSRDIYAVGAPISGPVTVTFLSEGAVDGRIIESTETSGVGGDIDTAATGAGALRIGDTTTDQQFRSFLSFHTGSLPDGAAISSATLQLRRGAVSGANPFTTHGPCRVDVADRFFGSGAALEVSDFQAPATAVGAATLSNPTFDGALSTASLNLAGRAAISRLGRTQFRIYCNLDDDDDAVTDTIGFHPGDAAVAANRPVLIVTYQ